MKKILLNIFAVLLVLASCTKYPSEASDSPLMVSDPTITFSAVEDSSFTVTIDAPEGTGFYSYLIDQDTEASELNPSKLLAVSYKSLAQGTVDFTVTPSKVITVKKLTPNTSYQVYAVAANGQGIIGKVVNASTLTTDGLTPTPKSFKITAASGSVAVTYNEPIVIAGSGAKAYATYYAINYLKDSTTVEIPADNIKVSGNVLTFAVKDLTAGAYVNITWEDGLVNNAVGTTGRGYMKRGFNESEPSKSLGVTFRIPTDTWDFVWEDENEDGDTLVYFSDWKALMPSFEGRDMWWYDYMGEIENAVSVTYHYTSGNQEITAQMPISNWGCTDDTHIGMKLASEPPFMSTLDIELAKGIAEDVYGNPNAAFSRKTAYKRMLVSTGLPGVYTTTATSYFSSRGTFTFNIVISENENGTYTISNFEPYFGSAKLAADLIATYDKENKMVSIAGGQPVGKGNYTNVLLYGGDTKSVETAELSTSNPVELKVLTNGWLEMATCFGATDDPEGGWWNLMNANYTFIKISNDPQEAPAQTPQSAVLLYKIQK